MSRASSRRRSSPSTSPGPVPIRDLPLARRSGGHPEPRPPPDRGGRRRGPRPRGDRPPAVRADRSARRRAGGLLGAGAGKLTCAPGSGARAARSHRRVPTRCASAGTRRASRFARTTAASRSWTRDGIRALGLALDGSAPSRIDILLSHLHLDHLEGLGFFAPLWDPKTELHIWGRRRRCGPCRIGSPSTSRRRCSRSGWRRSPLGWSSTTRRTSRGCSVRPRSRPGRSSTEDRPSGTGSRTADGASPTSPTTSRRSRSTSLGGSRVGLGVRGRLRCRRPDPRLPIHGGGVPGPRGLRAFEHEARRRLRAARGGAPAAALPPRPQPHGRRARIALPARRRALGRRPGRPRPGGRGDRLRLNTSGRLRRNVAGYPYDGFERWRPHSSTWTRP